MKTIKLPYTKEELQKQIHRAQNDLKELIRVGAVPEQIVLIASEYDREEIENCTIPPHVKINYLSSKEQKTPKEELRKKFVSKIPPDILVFNDIEQTIIFSKTLYKPNPNAYFFLKSLWELTLEGKPQQTFSDIKERVNAVVPSSKTGQRITSNKISDVFSDNKNPDPKQLIESPKGMNGFFQFKFIRSLNTPK